MDGVSRATFQAVNETVDVHYLVINKSNRFQSPFYGVKIGPLNQDVDVLRVSHGSSIDPSDPSDPSGHLVTTCYCVGNSGVA